MKYEIRFKKDRERGGEISVNFVSKGEASTFARAFELNFFTKAHLHVKGKTRVKGSFFLPLEYLTNSKDRLKFVEWRICIEVYPFVPPCELLRDFSLNFFFFFYRSSKKQTRLEFHERHIFIFVMSLRLNLSNCDVHNSIKGNIAI